MAEAKSKKPGAVARLYLASYNVLQALGWGYILCQIVQHYTKSSSDSTLWDRAGLFVIVFQNAAILEIIHATTGLVPSNVIVTLFQILSRVIVVEGVILATPYTYAAASVGLPLILSAWSITEIIRYSYYFFNLVGFMPSVIVWLRYTTFIVLYPLGVTGELLCMYVAVNYAIANPTAWSFTLPNVWNFTFSYSYFLIAVMILYIPIFPHLFLHMCAQRRKVLNPATAAAAAAAKKAH